MSNQNFTIAGSSAKPISIDLFSAGTGIFPLAIFVHGFKGFKDWGAHNLVAQYFAEREIDFLKFNFSHSGISLAGKDTFDDLNSFSLNTFSKELFDLNEVITFAKSGKEFPAPRKIFLIGHSRGGGISIIQAAEDKRIDKLVTWAALSNFRSLWPGEQEGTWRKEGVIYTHNSRTNQQMPLNVELLKDLDHNQERLDILNSAGNVAQPWLIIHGTNDTSVSPAQAQELNRQQASSNILLIPGADHTFGAKHPWEIKDIPEGLKAACDATIGFFKK